jgi:ketosteroid isomerase-like protein
MAKDLTDTIRNGLAAWNRGDVEEALVNLDPELDLETSRVFPDLDPVYHGHDGVRRFFSDFNATWQDLRIDVEQIVRGQGPLVAVAGRFHATGRDGIPVERSMAWVFTAHGETVTRVQTYGSWAEAFDAAVVPPEQRAGG